LANALDLVLGFGAMLLEQFCNRSKRAAFAILGSRSHRRSSAIARSLPGTLHCRDDLILEPLFSVDDYRISGAGFVLVGLG
jgi:hypothetical protein